MKESSRTNKDRGEGGGGRKEKTANTSTFIFSMYIPIPNMWSYEPTLVLYIDFLNYWLVSHLYFPSFPYKLMSPYHLRMTFVAEEKYGLRKSKWKKLEGVGIPRAIGFYKGIGFTESLYAGVYFTDLSGSKSPISPSLSFPQLQLSSCSNWWSVPAWVILTLLFLTVGTFEFWLCSSWRQWMTIMIVIVVGKLGSWREASVLLSLQIHLIHGFLEVRPQTFRCTETVTPTVFHTLHYVSYIIITFKPEVVQLQKSKIIVVPCTLKFSSIKRSHTPPIFTFIFLFPPANIVGFLSIQ